MGVLIAKPSEAIMSWIGGLAPTDELAVRMALCKTNGWCTQDEGWQRRIATLKAKLINSEAGEELYERRATEMAHDMDRALRSMMDTPDLLNR
jgi:hypothetical protein